MPQLSVILAPQAPEINFPGAELVEAAASLFHNGPVWDGREDTRRFRLELSAGTFGLRVSDPARYERNRQNGLGHDPQVGEPVRWLMAREAVGEERWRLVRGDDGRYEDADGFLNWTERLDVLELVIPVEDDGSPLRRTSPGSRQVQGWSRKSRARMVRRLAQLDWSPMLVDRNGYPASLGYGPAVPPVMGTLTYPGDWLALAPSGKIAKQHFTSLCKRYERRWGVPLICAWKLEFQDRGAPHFHFLFVPPRDPGFRDWLSSAWASIIKARADRDSNGYALELGYARVRDGERVTELLASTRAGTGLDHLRGGRCFDPKRAAVYFSKHGGAAGGKEYQHTVPVEWQGAGDGPGRFWGYRGLEPVVSSVDVVLEDYVAIRRTLRRWAKQSGSSRRVTVQTVNPRTGEIGYRTRRRKGLASLASRSLLGGTIVVNNGPGFASALARGPAATRPIGAFLP